MSAPQPAPDPAEELAAAAEAIVQEAIRTRRLSEQQAEDLFRSLCVPCPLPPRGCGNQELEPCVHIVDRGPLGRQVAHMARLKLAGRTWQPLTEAEQADPAALHRAQFRNRAAVAREEDDREAWYQR